MIEFKKGNIFESDCDYLVNPVNCVGVSGKGLALQFKNKYPEMFKEYKKFCDKGLLKPGSLHVWKNIINFPTKVHWRDSSKEEYIRSGLEKLVILIKDSRINSIALPGLGCGLGGLSWNLVRKLIEDFHEQLEDVKVMVYEP